MIWNDIEHKYPPLCSQEIGFSCVAGTLRRREGGVEGGVGEAWRVPTTPQFETIVIEWSLRRVSWHTCQGASYILHSKQIQVPFCLGKILYVQAA